ncbi:hypothetical protein ACFSTE_11635 [Aquimarina hainanensis]|uniref:Uncharacterized protein n=1 Tax=Aquimarina hainanensis TaxID=1578017 RepID=A0ABW5N891_9FLAO
MAPSKFDEEIKKRLEGRSITPSAATWTRLEEKLDAGKRKEKGFQLVKMLVAACVIGIVAVIVFRFTKRENISDRITNTDTILLENKIDSVQSTEIVLEKIVEDKKPIDKKTPQNNIVYKENKEQKQDIKIPAKENIAPSEESRGFVFEKTEEEMIQQEVANVLKEVVALEKEKEEVSDEEIEALLYKAQQKILLEKITKSNKVNATALLHDVELELDETFKERVFEALKVGFKKLHISIVDREN